jgi:ribosomal protein S18 acetylase RimI-like enzyme
MYTLFGTKLLLNVIFLLTVQEVEKGTYDIRRITDTTQLEEIAVMINEAYKKALWVADDVERITVEELAGIIQSPHASLYVCFEGPSICGAVMLDATNLSGELEMAMLTVHTDYQGKNIGSLLMSHAQQEAVTRYHKDALYLYVIPCGQERLVAYYQREGFEIVAELPFIFLHLVKPTFQDHISLYKMRKSLSHLSS